MKMPDEKQPVRLSDLQNRNPDGGLQCPKCGCRHLPAQYTRRRPGHTMRVRICRHCGRRITTREQVI